MKLVKAHIIPRSLYGKTLGHEEGPAKIVTNKVGVYPKRSQIGVYDSEILCGDCEAGFSDWDSYANTLFMHIEPEPVFSINNKPSAGRYSEFDQYKLQMFFISLVWRMHSANHEMFRVIKLGLYEKKAVASIHYNDPSLFPELDVFISRFDSELAEAVAGPSKLRIEGINGYRVNFARHVCWVKIDRRPFPHPFNLMAISTGTPLHILYREFDGSPEKRAMIETVRDIDRWTKLKSPKN